MKSIYNLVFSLLLVFSAASYADNGPTNDSFSDYKHFAVLSEVAYHNKSKIKQTAEKLGWLVSHYRIIPDIEVLYYILSNHEKRSQVLVVRGTANAENALIDAAHKLIPNSALGIKLHEGFALAAGEIYAVAKTQLVKDYKTIITGHSLGGAVAVILAMHMDKDDYAVDAVYTYGQPKVTNITGALTYKQLNLIRVVTPKDLVPLVPPFDALDVNNLDIYWHLGREVILLPGNKYSETSGIESMLRASNILSEKIDERNVVHHSMSHYIVLIEKKLGDAEKVVHKNNLNLFKLFSQ